VARAGGTGDVSAHVTTSLPFKGKVEPPPPQAPVHRNEDPLNATAAAVVDAALLAQLRQGLPFAGGAAPAAPDAPIPQLTLEQYASLCAECEAFPDRTADALARYQIHNDATRRALDTHWRDTFARAPDSKQRWTELQQQYKAWLLSQHEARRT
jgi:hypothetical protein